MFCVLSDGCTVCEKATEHFLYLHKSVKLLNVSRQMMCYPKAYLSSDCQNHVNTSVKSVNPATFNGWNWSSLTAPYEQLHARLLKSA